jgi:hypothetical protein
MRSAGNFSPEWGYLAPAPSFMRTARVVLVATAVGATAGAAVVLSLIDRPAVEGEKSLVAAHAIVTSVQAATAMPTPVTAAPVASVASSTAVITTIPVNAPPAAQAPPQPAVVPQSMATITSPAATAEPAAALPQRSSSGIAALSEPSPTSDAARSDLPDGTTLAPGMVAPPKKWSKHPGAANAKNQRTPGLGSALRRIFSAHAGTSYYPAR